MNRFGLLLLGLTILLYGKGELNINPTELEQIVATHPTDLPNRLLLTRYYLEQYRFEEAKRYLEEAKRIAPTDKKVQKLSHLFKIKWEKYQAIQQVFRPIIQQYGSLDDYITALYNKGDYKAMRDFYLRYRKFLKLSDSSWIKLAKVFDWDGKYKITSQILKKVKDKTGLDYYTLTADVAFNLQNYKKAIKYYRLLFKLTGETTFGKRLAQLYIWQGDLEKAQKTLLMMMRKRGKVKGKGQIKDKEIAKLWALIQQKKEEYIQRVKKAYEESPSFANLQRYVYAVSDRNLTKGVPIVENHIKLHPLDQKAKFFLAKLYAWTNQYEKAIKYLKKLTENKKAQLLLAQILSWQGHYEDAEKIFRQYVNDSDPKIAYKAKKGIALILAWTNKRNEAITMLEELYQINPKDQEVKTQLLLLKGNPKDLINYYKTRLAKNPNDGEALLGLADTFYKLKKFRLAGKYYEKYLMLNPNKLELYKTLGDVYLQLKDFYKGFSNWEYYAYMKGTREAYLELAKRYYWYGFNNEALKVLNDLLTRVPRYREARLLKAKILKVNPRFVVASSAATFQQYLGNREKKLIELGDRAYFNGFYESAIKYYWTVLSWNPENYDVREKYAYALEYTGRYKDAAGEFFMLMWMKKNPQIEYNYAFALQKSGKYKQAEKVYKKLLNNVPRPAPKFIREFLDKWKKGFESMDSYKLVQFYSPKLANSPGWRVAKDRFFQKQVWVALSYFDPVIEETVEKGNRTIFKTRIWEIIATKYIKNKGRYRYLWIECPTDLVKKWENDEVVENQISSPSLKMSHSPKSPELQKALQSIAEQIKGKKCEKKHNTAHTLQSLIKEGIGKRDPNSTSSVSKLSNSNSATTTSLSSVFKLKVPTPAESCKIVKERLKNGKYKKFDPNSSIYHYIQQNLYFIKKNAFPIQHR